MMVKAMNHQVSCGNHKASNCGGCPQGHGARWCNGDCRWWHDQCVARSGTGVVCYDTSKDVCACGQPQCDTKEIIGGRVAKPHEYPWIVRLVGGCVGGSCAGTLVSPSVILTAFHCTIDYLKSNTESCDHSDGKRLAVLGRHEILPHRMSSYKTIPVIKVFTPPNAGLTDNDYKTHDFSLLQLKHPAKYSSKVSPICLPEPNAEFGGMK